MSTTDAHFIDQHDIFAVPSDNSGQRVCVALMICTVGAFLMYLCAITVTDHTKSASA